MYKYNIMERQSLGNLLNQIISKYNIQTLPKCVLFGVFLLFFFVLMYYHVFPFSFMYDYIFNVFMNKKGDTEKKHILFGFDASLPHCSIARIR